MADIDAKMLVGRLEAQLSPAELRALDALRRLAHEASIDLYLVGGAVRDLVLGRPNLDLDLAIEKDVAPVAQKLASELNARCVLHERFGTSTVSGPGWHLDLARTRRETYSHPGALPTVEPAPLQDDLSRRDFAINGMALRLNDLATLIDPHGGLLDVKARHIRVLHERSFQDDATRMLRAVRYASRLGFTLDAETEAWLRRDLPFLDAISGPRLRRELVLLMHEPSALHGAVLAGQLGILGSISPEISLQPEQPEGASRWPDAFAGPILAPRDETGFCVLAGRADETGVTSLSARLHLTGRFEGALRDAVRLRADSSKLAAMRHDPVAAVDMLDHFAPSAVWATAIVKGGNTAATCEAYLREWRHVKPLLRGDDVIALGVQPGVAVGETLRALRDARLRGAVTTREEQAAFVGELLGRSA